MTAASSNKPPTDSRPVTTADREAALAAKVNGAAHDGGLPPIPFDPDAGLRAFRRYVANPDAYTDTYEPKGMIFPVKLAGKTVPPRIWIVRDWIPCGTVTALYGDGGTGKSLLAQTLMTACATGRPFLGLDTTGCAAFGIFCEDEADELHRRQADINLALGVDWPDLRRMAWESRVGMDNVLMKFDPSGVGETTAAFDDLLDKLRYFEARLCVIDTAADTFGGNENVRPQVRQFIGHCLGKIARTIGGSVILCAHPSRAGLTSGEGDGGNTAWNNSVRSRLYLSRVKAEGDEQPDDGARILSRKKANYAGIGDSIDLRWKDGAFVVERAATGIFAGIEKRNAETVFLDALDKLTAQGRFLSDSSHAGNFAPKAIIAAGLSERFKKTDLRAAMERLFADGRIRMETYGREHDQRRRIMRGRDAE